jgi:hypothetical protein
MNISSCHNIVVWIEYKQNNLTLCEKCILLRITEKMGKGKILFKKQFPFVPLKAVLPNIGI